MMLTAGTEQLLQIFIVLAAVLLIPVAVGLMVVLFKLAFLIHSTSEFLRLASYELAPVIKDLRRLADQLEHMGHKASSSVQELGAGLSQAQPLLKKGFGSISQGASAILSGIGRSFRKTPR
jgi:hypothetical protein